MPRIEDRTTPDGRIMAEYSAAREGYTGRFDNLNGMVRVVGGNRSEDRESGVFIKTNNQSWAFLNNEDALAIARAIHANAARNIARDRENA